MSIMCSSRGHRRSDRLSRDSRGFIIPAAIVAMIVVSLMALTGLYVAQNTASANIGISNSWKALYAADAGAKQILLNWKAEPLRNLAPGESFDTGWRTLDNGSVYRTQVMRVDDGSNADTTLYRLRTVGRPGSGLTAQRTIITMVRSTKAREVCCDAAIKVQGPLRIQGSAVEILGQDYDPPLWGGRCAGPGSDLPGVVIQNLAELQKAGHPTIDGAPPILEDPTISDSDFIDFGGVSYADLVAMADKQFSGSQSFSDIFPVVDGGECVTSSSTNWGDPLDATSPCYDYMPIIHIGGDLKLTGNAYGQGVLLVDGNVSVTGTADFYGVIIVQGEADIKGTANVFGGMLVRNGLSATEQTSIAGSTTIQYSSCVMSQAISRLNVTTEFPGRHWFEVF